MSTIKFEIDSADIYEDGLESAIIEKIVYQLSSDFGKKAEAFVGGKIDKLIEASVEHSVERKLLGLMDEPIVLSDRWGKKVFLGSVEDYIKKQIDDKILQPVDNSGKAISGCTTSGQKTWIEWKTEEIINSSIKLCLDSVKASAARSLDSIAKQSIKAVTDDVAKEAISKAISGAISGNGKR